MIFQFCNSTEKYCTFNRRHRVGRWLIIGKIYNCSLWTTPNHVFYSVSVWRFFIWAWLPCSPGIFWFRSTLFGTTNFVKWTMTQLRLTKPHWLSWKILSPPVFESFLEIWHWVWEIVKTHIWFIRCVQPKLNLRICKFLCLRFCNLKREEEAWLDSFLNCNSYKKGVMIKKIRICRFRTGCCHLKKIGALEGMFINLDNYVKYLTLTCWSHSQNF